jgi:hypothetical protein
MKQITTSRPWQRRACIVLTGILLVGLESLPIHITGAAFVNGWIHAPGGGTDVGGSSGSTIHQVFWVGGFVRNSTRAGSDRPCGCV